MRKSVLPASLVLLLFVAPFSSAGEDLGARWREQLGRSSDHLKAGRFDASLKLSNRVLSEMHEFLGPGDAATELLGIAVTHKALALAGNGDREQALWWWHALLTMYPPFAKSDLSAYGAAGEFLAANRELKPPAPAIPADAKPDESITPPRVLKQVKPDFPTGARWFGVEGRLILEVEIGADGRLSNPRVLQALPAPTLSYAALDAVRRWRFEPAKRNGEAIPVIFHLSVNYKLAR